MVEHLTFNSDSSIPSFKVLRLAFAIFSSLLTAEKFGTYRIDLFHNGGLIIYSSISMIITVADPDLRGGGGHPDPEIRGRTGLKRSFSTLRASV